MQVFNNMKNKYKFTGFINLTLNQYHDIDKVIEAYSEKQAYFLLAKELSPLVKINREQLFFQLKKSKTLKTRILK